MTEPKPKALPCPWCGHDAIVEREPMGHKPLVAWCPNPECHCEMALTIEVWNRRAPDDEARAREAVCSEVVEIMKVYREQDASPNGVGTPGGLEHMGDVWRLLKRWDAALRAKKAQERGADGK